MDSKESFVYNERESKALYIVKAIAIFFVISAHVTETLTLTSVGYIKANAFLWSVLGKIGVPFFLMVSGYFYQRKKKDSIVFWKKKINTIFVPWIIGAIFSFTINVLIKGTENVFLDFFTLWIGYGSSFYYLTVLVLLFVMFKFLPEKSWIYGICVGVNMLSLTLETMGLNWISNVLENRYLNVLNWCGFFALGRWEKIAAWDKMIFFKKKIGVACLILFLSCFIVLAFIPLHIYLEYCIYIPYILAIPFLVACCSFAYYLAKTKIGGFVASIGKWSFWIYLFHMPIVQPICSRLPAVLESVKPFIGLGVMIILAIIFIWICKKCRAVWILKWCGIRE